MTTEPMTIAPSYRDVLKQAAIAYRDGHSERPTAEAVVSALLEAEKATKQQRSVYPLTALAGQWQLCCTTGVRKLRHGGIALRKGFYMPQFAPAHIGFQPATESNPANPDRGQISNQIQLGSLKLRFTGPAKYVGKKNLLAFDFTHIQLCWGDRPLYTGTFRGGKAKTEAFEQLSVAKLPFFAFFLVTDEFIAARGRGGGLALWIHNATHTSWEHNP